MGARLNPAAGLLLSLLALTACAGSPKLPNTNVYGLAGGWSKHFGNERDMNESHLGAGAEAEYEIGSWTLGAAVLNFSNSYDNRSTYVGAVAKRCAEPTEDWRACAGITGGVVDGYERRNDGGFAPALVGVADLSYRRFGAGFVCGPTDTGNGVCLGLFRIRLF
jgi:hypothetical protein